jgi:hypothetical protein
LSRYAIDATELQRFIILNAPAPIISWADFVATESGAGIDWHFA